MSALNPYNTMCVILCVSVTLFSSANEWNQMPNEIVVIDFDRKSNIFICFSINKQSVINPNNMAFLFTQGHNMIHNTPIECVAGMFVRKIYR